MSKRISCVSSDYFQRPFGIAERAIARALYMTKRMHHMAHTLGFCDSAVLCRSSVGSCQKARALIDMSTPKHFFTTERAHERWLSNIVERTVPWYAVVAHMKHEGGSSKMRLSGDISRFIDHTNVRPGDAIDICRNPTRTRAECKLCEPSEDIPDYRDDGDGYDANLRSPPKKRRHI